MNTNTTKMNDEEKPSGFFGTLKSLGSRVVSVVTGRSNDEGSTDMDLDSMGTVVEDGEEISEVLFQSLTESCTDEEVVVRSVRYLTFRASLSFDILGFIS